jgi:hypothetical protein
MEHFETYNLIIRHLFANFIEIKCYIFNFIGYFVFISYFLCKFRVSNTFLLCWFHDSLIYGCIFFGSKFQWFDLLYFYFYYFIFLIVFLSKSNRSITRLNRKLKLSKTIFYFLDELVLIFWLYCLDWVTTLGSNPPNIHPYPLHIVFDTFEKMNEEKYFNFSI